MAFSTDGATSLGPGPKRVRFGGVKDWKFIGRTVATTLDTSNGFRQCIRAMDRAKLATIIDRDFTCQPLLPTELTTAFDDGYVMIERAKTGMEAQAESSDGAHYRNRWTGGFFTVAR